MALKISRPTAGKLIDLTNFALLAICAVVALTAYGDILANNRFTKMRAESPIYFFDFSKYYICGKLAASDDRLNVYDADVQRRYLTQWSGIDKSRPVEYIQYPPIDFPLMLPLSKMEMSRAFSCFFLGSLALALLGSFLLTAGKSRRWRLMALIWLAISGSLPLFRAFSLGQTSLFTLAMAAVYLAGLFGGSQILAGVALAFTTIKPQYTIYFVLPALFGKRWQILITAALTELLLLALAASTIGIANVVNYPQIVMHADQNEQLAGVFATQMVNLRALFCPLLGETAAMKASSLACAASLGGLALLWWKFAREKRLDEAEGTAESTAEGRPSIKEKMLALTIFACLTTGPHTHLYDCLLLAAAAILITPMSMTKIMAGHDRRQKLLNCLLFFYPILGWALIYWPIGKEAAATLPFAAINLILTLLALSSVVASRKQQPAALNQG